MAVDLKKTMTEQQEVFDLANAIHAERTKVHGDLWRGDTILEHGFQTKHKATRLFNQLLDARCKGTTINHGAVEESALDLINYAAFIVRILHDRERGALDAVQKEA